MTEQPWASESGVNATRLIASHFDALNRSGSYTSRATRGFEPFNDSRYVFEGAFSAAASLAQGRMIYNWSGPGIVPTGEGEYVRYTEAGDPTWYSRVENATGAVRYGTEDVYYEEFAVRYLQGSVYFDGAPPVYAFRFEPAGTIERDGRTLYRFTADRPTADRPRGIVRGANLTDTTATLLVTRDGLITHLSFEYVSTVSNYGRTKTDARGRTTGTFRLTDIGTTTVDRPDWVDEASESDGDATS